MDSNKLVDEGIKALDEHNDAEAFRLFREAADAGDFNGEFLLGYCYVEGIGVTRNVVQGVSLIWQCTEKNHRPAMRQLGDYFQQGKYLTRDITQAVFWYQRAADAGNIDAMAELGGMYLSGEGVPVDIEKGRNLLLASGKLSQKVLLEKLCTAYARVGDKENYEKCHEELAEIGSPEDQYRLGMSYAKGENLQCNYEKARYWLEKSGCLDQVPAAIALILMLNAPWPAMLEVYQTWAKKANKKASGYAMELHRMYREGRGVAADAHKAALWFYQAALTQDDHSLQPLPFYYRPDGGTYPHVNCEGGQFWQDDENYYLKLELETGCIEDQYWEDDHIVVAEDDTSGVRIEDDLVIVSKARYRWYDFVEVSVHANCGCGFEDHMGCLDNQVALLAFRPMDAASHFEKNTLMKQIRKLGKKKRNKKDH